MLKNRTHCLAAWALAALLSLAPPARGAQPAPAPVPARALAAASAAAHTGATMVPSSVASAALAGSAPAGAARRNAPEFVRIASRGELVVAMLRTDTPPFFYVREGELRGTDADLARELARSLGVAVRFDRSAASFNEVVDKVSRGEADVGISKISRTLARAQAVLFSDAYLTLHHGLVLNRLEFAKLARDRAVTDVMRDFNGRLGVIAKSSFEDFAQRNFPKARLVPYATWADVVAAVDRGEVVGAYRDEFEVKRLLTEKPQAALKLRTVTLKDQIDAISIAVGADAPTLQAYINLFLATRNTKLGVDDVLRAMPAS